VIHAIALPTPFAVGRVNCYLVEDDPLTLVDCGPNSGTALEALDRGLAEHGHAVGDLERIVLTHQHLDHVGLAQILAERSGAEVCAYGPLGRYLADAAANLVHDDAYAEAIMLRHGVPRDVATALQSVSQSYHGWGSNPAITHPLLDGDVLGFANRRWHVHHRPGHSPSDLVFHDRGSGVLIGGDHLLSRISSNPVITRPLEAVGVPSPDDRPHALELYLESLRQTRAMEVTQVLGGHGDPVDDHRALIDERLQGHERRATRIADLLAEQPGSAFDLAGRIWGNVAVTQAYLTLSEVLGHLDLLIDRGDVVAEDGGAVMRFRRC
jgi:glyoxylase-like metal-dependent hydrolase (beta-lactamase superfamily II)